MLELASMGAKVLLNRSVELAKKLSVKLVTRNSFNHSEGTLIVAEKDFKGERMETPIVSGIALDKNQARVSMEAWKTDQALPLKSLALWRSIALMWI